MQSPDTERESGSKLSKGFICIIVNYSKTPFCIKLPSPNRRPFRGGRLVPSSKIPGEVVNFSHLLWKNSLSSFPVLASFPGRIFQPVPLSGGGVRKSSAATRSIRATRRITIKYELLCVQLYLGTRSGCCGLLMRSLVFEPLRRPARNSTDENCVKTNSISILPQGQCLAEERVRAAGKALSSAYSEQRTATQARCSATIYSGILTEVA